MGRNIDVTIRIGSNLFDITHTYNADGALTSTDYPNTMDFVANSYDAIGRVAQVAIPPNPDPDIGGPGINFLTINSYNAAGQVLNQTYGNGMQATYGYNKQMQLGSIVVQHTATILSLAYNYGGAADNGQIQGVTDNLVSARSTSYTYDLLSRLSAAQTLDQTSAGTWGLSFAYDRYGNRLSETPTGGTASMPSNQVLVDAATNHITTAGYSYDPNGNITSDGIDNYTYDGANRMITATPVGGGSTTTFTYDAFGQRVSKNTTIYVFDGGHVISEFANGGYLPNAEYIYAGGRKVANIIAGAVTYNYGDHLSTRVNADSSGNVIRNSTDFPFGESAQDTGSASGLLTKWKFTTYERDPETGLDYAMARFYGNRLGRFMSLDPVAADAGDPQSHNRYTYAGNDPINLMDPTGMDDCCGDGDGGFGLGDGGTGGFGLGGLMGVDVAPDWGAISILQLPLGSLNDLGLNPGAMGLGLLTDDWQIPFRSLADTIRSLLPWRKNCNVVVVSDCNGLSSGFTSTGTSSDISSMFDPIKGLGAAVLNFLAGLHASAGIPTSNYAAGLCVTTVPQLRKFGGCSYTCAMLREDPLVDPDSLFFSFPRFKGPDIDQKCGPGTFCPASLVIEEEVPPPGPILFLTKANILSCTM